MVSTCRKRQEKELPSQSNEIDADFMLQRDNHNDQVENRKRKPNEDFILRIQTRQPRLMALKGIYKHLRDVKLAKYVVR